MIFIKSKGKLEFYRVEFGAFRDSENICILWEDVAPIKFLSYIKEPRASRAVMRVDFNNYQLGGCFFSAGGTVRPGDKEYNFFNAFLGDNFSTWEKEYKTR